MLHQKPKAYAVHFFQRGCCTQPQMLDYEGGKHIAPHTYIGATTYAVPFFQRGCCTQPHMLDYEGGRHIAPHTRYSATASAVFFFQRGYSTHPQYSGAHSPPPEAACCTFLPARLLNTPTDSGLRRQEKHSPPHILLKQPTLYISSSEATQHIHRFWITKAGDTQPPHIYCYSSLCCTFLAGRLLSTPTDSGLRRQETHSPPHIYC